MVSPNSRAPLSDDKLRLLVMQARESLRQRQAGIIPDPANTAPGVWNDPTPPALQPNSATLVSTGSQPMGPANRPSSSIIPTPQNANTIIARASGGRTIYIDPNHSSLTKMAKLAKNSGYGGQSKCHVELWKRLCAAGLSTYQGKEVLLPNPAFNNHVAEGLYDMTQYSKAFEAIGSGPSTVVEGRGNKKFSLPTLDLEKDIRLLKPGMTLATTQNKAGFKQMGTPYGNDVLTITAINYETNEIHYHNFAKGSGVLKKGKPNPVYKHVTDTPVIALVHKSALVKPPLPFPPANGIPSTIGMS
jgi:hypothetical protein